MPGAGSPKPDNSEKLIVDGVGHRNGIRELFRGVNTISMADRYIRIGGGAGRRIAQEIIVEQQQEIAAMRLALEDSPLPSAASPDQTSAAGRTDPQTTSHDSMHVHQEP